MRSKAVVVAAIIAAAAFGLTWNLWSEFWASDACFDAGGSWDPKMEICRGVEGFEDRSWSVGGWMLLLGLPTGIAIGAGLCSYFVARSR